MLYVDTQSYVTTGPYLKLPRDVVAAVFTDVFVIKFSVTSTNGLPSGAVAVLLAITNVFGPIVFLK